MVKGGLGYKDKELDMSEESLERKTIELETVNEKLEANTA
jgi:hypothetical protein